MTTYGLTHIALAVADVARASAFYRRVFGMRIVDKAPDFVQLQTPGARDVLVLEHDPRHAGRRGNIAHFGFRLVRPDDVDRVAAAVRRAGGTIRAKGEFVPGEPYVFAVDPDGNEFEVWYELPTPIDPGGRSARRRSKPRHR